MEGTTRSREKLEYLGKAADLWEQYLNSRSINDRNKLVEYYYPWCRKIALGLYLRLKNSLVECNDVIHICSLSLISCLEKFDPYLGVPFEAYAYKRLKGSVHDQTECYYRDYRNKAVDLSEEYYIDRLPHPDENSDPFESIVDAAIKLAFGAFLELGVLDASSSEQKTPHGAYACNQQSVLLMELVEKLPENERFVMKSYYYQHLSFAEIAKASDKTRARISQLHSKALTKLRKLYEFYTS